MAAQPQARPNWLRWFAVGDPQRLGWWRLIRFASVDAGGNPVGKPIVSLTPTRHPRQFRNEQSADFAAAELNRQDGL